MAYDARPDAGVPSSGKLGEEIYLTESDKGNCNLNNSVQDPGFLRGWCTDLLFGNIFV